MCVEGKFAADSVRDKHLRSEGRCVRAWNHIDVGGSHRMDGIGVLAIDRRFWSKCGRHILVVDDFGRFLWFRQVR